VLGDQCPGDLRWQLGAAELRPQHLSRNGIWIELIQYVGLVGKIVP
jgi:hypothetical protein